MSDPAYGYGPPRKWEVLLNSALLLAEGVKWPWGAFVAASDESRIAKIQGVDENSQSTSDSLMKVVPKGSGFNRPWLVAWDSSVKVPQQRYSHSWMLSRTCIGHGGAVLQQVGKPCEGLGGGLSQFTLLHPLLEFFNPFHDM